VLNQSVLAFVGQAPNLPAEAGSIGHVAADAAAAKLGSDPLAALAPLDWISVAGALLLALLAGGALLLRWRFGRQPVGTTVTWDCGYAAPTARMQYTSSSFAQMLVAMFGWALRPSRHVCKPDGPFPASGEFHSDVPDTVLDRAVIPGSHALTRWLMLFRWFQQGNLQVYLLYIFAVLVILLLWR
jgi:hypothetical protein